MLGLLSAGKAVWKLDDPATMREEIAARAAAAASAARKKLEGAVERKAKELEKLEGLAALPSIQVRGRAGPTRLQRARSEKMHFTALKARSQWATLPHGWQGAQSYLYWSEVFATRLLASRAS